LPFFRFGLPDRPSRGTYPGRTSFFNIQLAGTPCQSTSAEQDSAAAPAPSLR
jgi:hypothetical protein